MSRFLSTLEKARRKQGQTRQKESRTKSIALRAVLATARDLKLCPCCVVPGFQMLIEYRVGSVVKAQRDRQREGKQKIVFASGLTIQYRLLCEYQNELMITCKSEENLEDRKSVV